MGLSIDSSLPLVLGALLIFSMRIADVSIGTMRVIVLVRGQRVLAGALGFFESLIWLLATAQVITNLDSPLKIVAFCGGYAAGTMVGSTVERWIALGKSLVRIVTPAGSPSVAEALREEGFYATVVEAEGRDGGVRIAFSIVPRKAVARVFRLVRETAPNAFVTVEEARTVNMSPAPSWQLQRWRLPGGLMRR